MSTTVALPDGLYARLSSLAQGRGVPTERLLRQLVEEAIERSTLDEPDEQVASSPACDPIAAYIGAFDFGVDDLAENHDRYLGEAHAERHDSSR